MCCKWVCLTVWIGNIMGRMKWMKRMTKNKERWNRLNRHLKKTQKMHFQLEEGWSCIDRFMKYETEDRHTTIRFLKFGWNRFVPRLCRICVLYYSSHFPFVRSFVVLSFPCSNQLYQMDDKNTTKEMNLKYWQAAWR